MKNWETIPALLNFRRHSSASEGNAAYFSTEAIDYRGLPLRGRARPERRHRPFARIELPCRRHELHRFRRPRNSHSVLPSRRDTLPARSGQRQRNRPESNGSTRMQRESTSGSMRGRPTRNLGRPRPNLRVPSILCRRFLIQEMSVLPR